MTVDPEDVISIGDDLLERYPDMFSADFERNKRHVEDFTELRSRHVRNRVAGYITRQYPAKDVEG
jgi:small subunit ribosomal protein S17e